MKNALGILILGASLRSLAHEGHDTPGALPPPPHGGRVAEASHSEDHHEDHEEEGNHEAHKDEKEEVELFLEAKLEGTKLKIYPLALEASRSKVFKLLKPSPTLRLSDLKIELPRSKRAFSLKVTSATDFWEAQTGDFKDKRLFVHATLLDDEGKKVAKIQVEK